VIREVRELVRSVFAHVRELVLAALVLGVLYVVSGGRLVLLALMGVVLAIAWRFYERPLASRPEADEGSELGYEDVLEVLLGLVGQPVTTLIGMREGEGSPPGLVELHGTLASAEPDGDRYELLDERYRDGEVLFVAIDDSGFWLPRADLAGGRLIDDPDKAGLDLHVGATRIALFDDAASRERQQESQRQERRA